MQRIVLQQRNAMASLPILESTMPHPHADDIRRSHGDKLDDMTGARGEHPMDRASRIAGVKVSANAQGDAASPEEEVFIAAPARQISNHGKVRK